jgi:hypothetical protein
VSRDWAYKRREVDAAFDAPCREMLALFRDTPLQTGAREPRASGRMDGGARAALRRSAAPILLSYSPGFAIAGRS